MLTVMARAGLRLDEALALRPDDFDQERGAISIKGDRARLVGLDAVAFRSVARWMAARKEWGISDTSGAPAFCTLKGEPLEPAYIRQLLPRLAKKAGIKKRVHAMAFRNALAAQLAAEGLPIGAIQAVLGHSSPATTSRLVVQVTRVAPEDVVSMMRNRSWQAGESRDVVQANAPDPTVQPSGEMSKDVGA